MSLQQQTALPAPGESSRAVLSPVPDRSVAHYLRLDRALVTSLLVLAFMLGSFAIGHHTFWLHLATGRYLADDLSGLGVDPFLYTTTGILWVNHSWLYDLIIYGLHSTIGGPALVLLKAILLVATAWIMLQVRPERGNVWLNVVCVGLGLVAMSPLLVLDQACLSVFFLALTLYLLLRPVEETRRISWWWLPPLILLWVNLDSWFILGPLCVILVLAGEAFAYLLTRNEADGAAATGERESRVVRRHRLRTLGVVTLVSLGACLVNPFGYRAFTLPPELAYILAMSGDFWPGSMVAAGTALASIDRLDPSFLIHFSHWQSPFADDYWLRWTLGPNLAGLAYWLLLLAGVASYLAPLILDKDARTQQYSWPRFLLWLVFALLSLAMARFILFFAVVAAPITAWNWWTILQRLPPTRAGNRFVRSGAILGRWLTLGALIGLLLLCWPGWIQGRWGSGDSLYRVHWDVVPDPGLVEAAAQLGELQTKGELDRCWNYSPELASYCAWYSPNVKLFFDLRFGLIRDKARDLALIRRALQLQAIPVPAKDKDRVKAVTAAVAQGEELMERYQVSHVALTGLTADPDLLPPADRLLTVPRHWSLTFADGNTVIFRWSAAALTLPADSGPGAGFKALAFTGPAKKIGAPDDQIIFPEPPSSLANYLFGQKRAPLALARGWYYLRSYDVLRIYAKNLKRDLTVGYDDNNYDYSLPALALYGGDLAAMAPQVGLAAAPLHAGGSLAALETLKARSAAPVSLPELPLLTMQAARQAIAENPNAPGAYRLLFDAVEALEREEDLEVSKAAGRFCEFRKVARHTQKLAALQHLVLLRPQDIDAHQLLADFMLKMKYDDAALAQIRTIQEIVGRQPALAANKQESLGRKTVEEISKDLAKEVDEKKAYLAQISDGLRPAEKGLLAVVPPELLPPELAGRMDKKMYPFGLGLALVALEQFEAQDMGKLAPHQQSYIFAEWLKLLTSMGRMKELHNLLAAHDMGKDLGFPGRLAYCHFAAAMGAYTGCDRMLADIESVFQKASGGAVPEAWLSIDADVSDPAGLYLFAGLPAEAAGAHHPTQLALMTLGRLARLDQTHRQPGISLVSLAETRMARGLIALEAGDPEKAERFLAATLRLMSPLYQFGDQAVAEFYLRHIRAAKARHK
jgi:hypothetical protein